MIMTLGQTGIHSNKYFFAHVTICFLIILTFFNNFNFRITKNLIFGKFGRTTFCWSKCIFLVS